MKNKGLNGGTRRNFRGVVRSSAVPSRKRGEDPRYRAFIRSFGCVACFGGIMPPDEFGPLENLLQGSRTECAHVGRRGLSQKCPDCESLPLCAIEHHRIGPESHHRLGKRFWDFHGLNRVELITQLQALYEVESGKPARLRRKVRVR
jgi:hypothetical protein